MGPTINEQFFVNALNAGLKRKYVEWTKGRRRLESPTLGSERTATLVFRVTKVENSCSLRFCFS